MCIRELPLREGFNERTNKFNNLAISSSPFDSIVFHLDVSSTLQYRVCSGAQCDNHVSLFDINSACKTHLLDNSH